MVRVQARLQFRLDEPAQVGLGIALAAPDTEQLEVTVDGAPVNTRRVEVGMNRVDIVDAPTGDMVVTYNATATPGAPSTNEVTEADRILWLRQSRYCPSDRLEAFARAEFGEPIDPSATAHTISEWVFQRIGYVPGWSRSDDDATHTLLSASGVCRDFAHLTITLCRAVGIPARYVAAYAPGLDPMDFHAVAEIAGNDGWEIIDSTRLAPRQSLARIGTGHDATDTALLTDLRGHAEFTDSSLLVTADGDLPLDDHTSRVAIA